MKYVSTFLIAVLSSLLCACTHQQVSEGEQGDTLQFKYAENLMLVDYQYYTEVTMQDPWNKGKILHTYVLVPYDHFSLIEVYSDHVLKYIGLQ